MPRQMVLAWEVNVGMKSVGGSCVFVVEARGEYLGSEGWIFGG